MVIYHIGVHTLYYETHTLFSSTRSRIYDKEKYKRVKVIIFNKYAMDLDALLFEPTVIIIGRKLSCTGSSCVYVGLSSNPASMACKDQKHYIKPVFLISQYRK